MKLLFDQNLSPRLAVLLADLFPGSDHVPMLGLDCSSDDDIWNFSRGHGVVIVSKDADYDDLSVVRGSPPWVIWLQIGNCTNDRVLALLRANHAVTEGFEKDGTMGTLCLR